MNLKLLKENIKNLLIEEANALKSINLIDSINEINKKIKLIFESNIKESKNKYTIRLFLESCEREYAEEQYEISFCVGVYDLNEKKYLHKENYEAYNKIWAQEQNIEFYFNNLFKNEENLNLEEIRNIKSIILKKLINDTKIPYGKIIFGPQFSDKTKNKCLDSFTVYETHRTKNGWGALLYDLAMEISSAMSTGLTPDRRMVSSHAYGIWKNYFENRPDVSKIQLDIDKEQNYVYGNKLPQLTPDYELDDCTMQSAINQGEKEKWNYSPLSKVYRKNMIIVPIMKNLDLLIDSIGY
jgi:hypothetical protein